MGAQPFNYHEALLPPAAPKTLADALLAVQKGAPKIQRDAINPAFRSKYVSLDSLMPQILPLLNENDLVLTQLVTSLPGADGPTPALTTRLTHVASGESIEATAPLMLDKQTAQGLGSAITYLRRYALLSILGLVADVDDDGNAASEKKPTTTRPRTTTPRKPADKDEDW